MNTRHRGISFLHFHLVPPLILLIFGAFSGGYFLYLGLRLVFTPSVLLQRICLLGTSYILLFGAVMIFYRHAKWIEYCTWVFNYGDIERGKLRIIKRLPYTMNVSGNLIVLRDKDRKQKYKVIFMKPYLSNLPSRSHEHDVKVISDPSSKIPRVIDSGEKIFWIRMSKLTKEESA